MAFLVQGDKKNEWWSPTPNQKAAIAPIYKKWLGGLGQGTMMHPGTEIVANASFDGFTYLIFINLMNSSCSKPCHKSCNWNKN